MRTEHQAHPAEDGAADRLILDSGITVRPWAEGDDLRLLEVWGDPESTMHLNDRGMLQPSSNEPWRRTVVAEDEGIPVAAATVYRSSLHPQRLWYYSEVAPDHRRQGLGAQLLEILEAEIPNCGTQSLKARCAKHSAAQCFLKDNGFTKIQRSREVVVQPGALPLPDLEGAGLDLQDIATGSVELSTLVAEFYNAVHDWDPAEMTVGRAQQMLLAPATGASGVVVLREASGRILSFAISYTPERTEDPADVLLGWNPELDEEQAEAAVRALLALLAARYPVKVEVDDAMVPLRRVTEELIASGDAEFDVEALIYARDAA